MKIIGITGGIGGGKTSILNYISSHYIAEIYYADEVARELEQPGICVRLNQRAHTILHGRMHDPVQSMQQLYPYLPFHHTI